MPARLRTTANRLRTLGLHRAADANLALAAHLGPDPDATAETAWVDVYLRIQLAAELHS